MKHSFLKTIILVAVIILSAGCSDEEPFDVVAGQRQMSGSWTCKETSNSSGDPLTYQIRISPNGAMGLSISNYAGLGITARADFPDENTLLIPSQDQEGFRLEGKGTISKYKKMTLTFSYTSTTRVDITADCSKIE